MTGAQEADTRNDGGTTPDARWVVVTGAGSGIGREVARSASRAGYSVVLVGRDHRALATTAQALHASKTVIADISDAHATPALRDALNSLPLWGLVNCAGIPLVGHFLEVTEDEWTSVLRTNVEGALRTTQVVARQLTRQQTGGAIVHIGSISGDVPGGMHAAYAASKAAIVGFTKALAIDLGPADVTVNAVSPGIVRTQIWEDIVADESNTTGRDPEEVFRSHTRAIPLGRAQTTADIAQTVLFLLSGAARNISGSVIPVTGGMSSVTFDGEDTRRALARVVGDRHGPRGGS